MDLGRIIQAFEQGGTPVVRTDFSDDESWELVVYELTKPDDDGVEAHVTPVEDSLGHPKRLDVRAARLDHDDARATHEGPERPVEQLLLG